MAKTFLATYCFSECWRTKRVKRSTGRGGGARRIIVRWSARWMVEEYSPHPKTLLCTCTTTTIRCRCPKDQGGRQRFSWEPYSTSHQRSLFLLNITSSIHVCLSGFPSPLLVLFRRWCPAQLTARLEQMTDIMLAGFSNLGSRQDAALEGAFDLSSQQVR